MRLEFDHAFSERIAILGQLLIQEIALLPQNDEIIRAMLSRIDRPTK